MQDTIAKLFYWPPANGGECIIRNNIKWDTIQPDEQLWNVQNADSELCTSPPSLQLARRKILLIEIAYGDGGD